VRLSNIRGSPPPPTTKLAIFYNGGYEAQLLLNATGYATAEKWKLFEMQLRRGLEMKGLSDKCKNPSVRWFLVCCFWARV
jgi:hypothetical protein